MSRAWGLLFAFQGIPCLFWVSSLLFKDFWHSVTINQWLFLADHGEICPPHGRSTWWPADQPTTRRSTWISCVVFFKKAPNPCGSACCGPGLRVAMRITHVGGKFRHDLVEKSINKTPCFWLFLSLRQKKEGQFICVELVLRGRQCSPRQPTLQDYCMVRSWWQNDCSFVVMFGALSKRVSHHLAWPLCRNVSGILVVYIWEDFAGGFFWALFSHKSKETKSGDKIREKIRRPKNKNPRIICSAKIQHH